jgi:hypothetical protein
MSPHYSVTRLRVTFALIGVLLVLFAPRMAHAQDAGPVYREYRPSGCLQAIQRATDRYRRARPDTMPYDGVDTLPAVALQTARDCFDTLRVTSVDSEELVPLAQLQLVLENDSAARSLVARRLAMPDVRAPSARSWLLKQIVQAYVSVYPLRTADVTTYLRQLDSMPGADAAIARVSAYSVLQGYFSGRLQDSLAVRAAQTAIDAAKPLRGHDRQEVLQIVVYEYGVIAAAEAARTGDSAAPLAVLARAQADVGHDPQAARTVTGMKQVYRLLGAPAARLAAQFWIGTSGDTVYPAPGKPTLITFDVNRDQTPALRRVATRHHGSLAVVSVVSLRGYFQDDGPLQPAQEVAELRGYFTNDLGMVGTLAVTTAEFQRVFDGRRFRLPSANERAYAGAYMVLVDSQQRVRRLWFTWAPAVEPRIEHALAASVR